MSHATYDDLSKKAKELLEPWIEETVDYAKRIMEEDGFDIYVAADLAASRMEVDDYHGEILRRLREQE